MDCWTWTCVSPSVFLCRSVLKGRSTSLSTWTWRPVKRHLSSQTTTDDLWPSAPGQDELCLLTCLFIVLMTEGIEEVMLSLHSKSLRMLTMTECVCFVSVDELYPGRPYGALDSGFNSVDSGDKRWSGNEVSYTHSFSAYPILCLLPLWALCLCVFCVCSAYRRAVRTAAESGWNQPRSEEQSRRSSSAG